MRYGPTQLLWHKRAILLCFGQQESSSARDRKRTKQISIPSSRRIHSSWECHYVNESIHNITNTWFFLCFHQSEAGAGESFRCAPHLLSLGLQGSLT
ncbi:hypothetical protein CDAR_368291 [Caerostris darwini]|uniref:Ycf15 n=1 Tax=Caerostris darwini TaxID=1538125 RepID=A0AAV4WHD3_9ARAC|nr:hypothetical protein CDAR_368291 [Caerostris darwini]